jgi:hypothetical protein
MLLWTGWPKIFAGSAYRINLALLPRSAVRYELPPQAYRKGKCLERKCPRDAPPASKKKNFVAVDGKKRK